MRVATGEPLLIVAHSTKRDEVEPSAVAAKTAMMSPVTKGIPQEATQLKLDMDFSQKKSVRWSTVTVYEFGVAMGGSAVPRRGGPSIGLARKPKSIWSATIDAIEYESLSSEESDAICEFKGGDLEEKPITPRMPDSRRAVVARRRRVRWLKPQERVQLLTKAGCSEKRIYRMMMESSEIAMSRRLCITIQRNIPV